MTSPYDGAIEELERHIRILTYPSCQPNSYQAALRAGALIALQNELTRLERKRDAYQRLSIQGRFYYPGEGW